MLETISRVRTVCAITLCALTHALACGEFSHSVDMIDPLSHHGRAVVVVRYFWLDFVTPHSLPAAAYYSGCFQHDQIKI